MMRSQRWVVFLAGIGLGAVGAVAFEGWGNRAAARPNDRFDDYVMCTGACAVNPRSPSDGVWLLDYKGGRLLGTVIDRAQGKILGWAEVDLTAEFEVASRQNVHFMMTTGVIAAGQAALYVAEVSTGKFAVYTLGPDPHTPTGIIIRRHDMSSFRKASA